ncbi:hypothetical protein [Pseudoalteromonas marina]|uniref:hypothetical protein n=1 Tax=Pseudoalteromonas marina TaxID=267375 RepID=UPI0023EFE444|nr:hypothetical protein [Pseudoalteromonas marina]
MNETKFTKGEWCVIDKEPERFNPCPVNNSVKMPSSKKTKYGACMYAVVGGFDTETQRSEAEANAHLIASAPKMYKFLDDIANGRGVDYPIEQLLKEARGE